MNCPNCRIVLERTTYARANVRQCPKCAGLFIPNRRARAIRQQVDKDMQKLLEEIKSGPRQDTREQIRCPQCGDKMLKSPAEDFGLMLDECPSCEFTWFDPRELALLQLAFEATPQRMELNAMRNRLKNMTPEERSEYELRLSKLRERGSPMQQALSEAASDLLFYWF